MSDDLLSVIHDEAELKETYKRARGGDAEAQYRLGKHFDDTERDETYDEKIAAGIPEQDPLYWFSRAAAQDHAGAQFALGQLYRDGRSGSGVEKNAAAVRWFEKAAAHGDGWAMWWVAAIYYRKAENNRRNPFKRLWALFPEDKNVALAVEWYEKVIAMGDSEERKRTARRRLYEIYNDGELVKRDPVKARKYLNETAEN